MKYRVETATKKNTKEFDKPNEDYFLVDRNNGIFIILDGVTRDKIDGIYPDPSPACEVSKIFIDKAYNYIMNVSSKESNYLKIIKNAFVEGNKEIEKFNHSYLGSFLPGTVGIIAIIKDNKLFYGYIGDCIGIPLNKQMKKEFTMCQTKLIHEHIKEFTAYEIRHNICNNIRHPYSYGVLDGREGAIDFIVTGEIKLDKYKELILLTDGLEQIIKEMSIKELFFSNATELLNSKFCDTSTDDKTVITVRMNLDENNIKNC